MPKKLRVKIQQKSNKCRVKIRYLMVVLAVVSLATPRFVARAADCPDVRVVFARGSGGEQAGEANYFAFRDALRSKLATTALSYDFINLTYPAVGVGADNIWVTLGALFGGGEAYTFGRSVATGSQNLINMVNSDACPHTKYVIGGYSQGAIVISKSLPSLNSDRVLYAATFGDPKLYLPEGKGPYPDACRNQNLSDYRRYVPDCQTYQGLLGGYQPYEPAAYAGKLGTWCNKHDFFCSPFRNMSKHTSYVADNLYEDASRVIFAKINQYFELGSKVSSPHDTAIVIDSTGSMHNLIDRYKSEALRLARETLDAGGRVALYDYRDLKDPYEPVERCNFLTCDYANFEQGLADIELGGGGDNNESLLSAAYHIMDKLEWKFGSTKSLVVLTDSGFHSPDRDRVTFDQVVALSRQIDPVNFYIITTPQVKGYYTKLAAQTDGQVVTNLDELSLLTDHILSRYDSLPRVEESAPVSLPHLEITEQVKLSDTSSRIRFETDGTETLVVLNDMILGITRVNEITITDLDPGLANNLTLVPLTAELRGEAVSALLNNGSDYAAVEYPAEDPASESTIISTSDLLNLPKAPNTGKV